MTITIVAYRCPSAGNKPVFSQRFSGLLNLGSPSFSYCVFGQDAELFAGFLAQLALPNQTRIMRCGQPTNQPAHWTEELGCTALLCSCQAHFAGKFGQRPGGPQLPRPRPALVDVKRTREAGNPPANGQKSTLIIIPNRMRRTSDGYWKPRVSRSSYR